MRNGRRQVARVLVSGLAALAILSAIGLATETVRACSGPPYDVNRADVIVEGWIERAEVNPAPSGNGPFHDVRVTMRVVRSLKGDAPNEIVFTDATSYFPDPTGGPAGFWAGSSGACGVLDDDPTGQYALIVFERHDGELATSLPLGAVFRDDPDDPIIGRFRQYLEGRLAPGTEPRVVPDHSGWGAWRTWLSATGWPFLLAGALLATTFAVLGLLWGRERWRNA